jgi:hypothetical protein
MPIPAGLIQNSKFNIPKLALLPPGRNLGNEIPKCPWQNNSRIEDAEDGTIKVRVVVDVISSLLRHIIAEDQK